jgi:hypothetical protein
MHSKKLLDTFLTNVFILRSRSYEFPKTFKNWIFFYGSRTQGKTMLLVHNWTETSARHKFHLF